MGPTNCKHHKPPLKKKDKEIPFPKGIYFVIIILNFLIFAPRLK